MKCGAREPSTSLLQRQMIPANQDLPGAFAHPSGSSSSARCMPPITSFNSDFRKSAREARFHNSRLCNKLHQAGGRETLLAYLLLALQNNSLIPEILQVTGSSQSFAPIRFYPQCQECLLTIQLAGSGPLQLSTSPTAGSRTPSSMLPLHLCSPLLLSTSC